MGTCSVQIEFVDKVNRQNRMKRRIFFIALGLIVATIFLCWGTKNMKLALTASVILLFFYFIGLCLFALIHYLVVKRWVKRKHYANVLWLFIIIVVGHVCIFLRLPDALPKAEMSLSEKMKYIYETDQRDRHAIFLWMFTANRDRLRFDYVWNLVEQDSIVLPQDKYYAIFVLHHKQGRPGAQDLQVRIKAHQMAKELLEEKEKIAYGNSRWLYEATYDRWQMSIGKKQKYGTQKLSFNSSYNTPL
jgi:uncharacterized membrane protein YhaH (DUF805 family)